MMWHQHLMEVASGDVTGIVQLTERDESGITYEVRLVLKSLSKGAFEQGDDQMLIWVERVDFGHTAATQAGGVAFVEAAREQARIADECWRRSR